MVERKSIPRRKFDAHVDLSHQYTPHTLATAMASLHLRSWLSMTKCTKAVSRQAVRSISTSQHEPVPLETVEDWTKFQETRVGYKMLGGLELSYPSQVS